ncbi:MAG: hypothetical protein FRX48_07164 [Lasallia pustulata]|uniref:Uncharacterized protein n=1 Tax=Lasallia pustulata TaxID=136370 RepID=A0A5M8PIT0_9LECA|nr:MAG: hypothetical protein FRX48_07164 [Lasallia pustulata]
MTSQDVPRNPATKDPIQISMEMALSTPSLPRTTPVSSPHPKRDRGRPQARTFSVAKHINATTVSAPAKRLNRHPISKPTKPQRPYQHRLSPTLFQPTSSPPALLCSETPSRFSTPGDNFLLSLLNAPPYPSAGHSAHTRPCENTAAHPTTPHHICTACCATALANIRSTPLLRLHDQRHSRRWPFVLPLCGACTASARAYRAGPAGYDGCGCAWRILGR